jgi:hypothetical protein
VWGLFVVPPALGLDRSWRWSKWAETCSDR